MSSEISTLAFNTLTQLLLKSTGGNATTTAGQLSGLFRTCREHTQGSDMGSVGHICVTLSFFASPIYVPHPEDVLPLQADALEEYLSSLGGSGWQCWRWLVDTMAGHSWIMGGLVVLGFAAGATAGMRRHVLDHARWAELLSLLPERMFRQVSGMTAAKNDEIQGEACTVTFDSDVQGVNKPKRKGKHPTPGRKPVTRSDTAALSL